MEGTSKGYSSLVEIVMEEYKPFDYKGGFKSYSDVNALYPLKEEYDDVPDIKKLILRVFVEIQMETLNEMVVQYLMLVLMLEKH